MAGKLILTIGISNSGKSTWSHQRWRENPTGVIIANRDKIREQIFGYTENSVREYHLRSDLSYLEHEVTKYEDTVIAKAWEENKTVIVDATHLEARYIDRFKVWDVPTELVWFDIVFHDALSRNNMRTRQVPEDIMKKQQIQYTELKNSYKWERDATEDGTKKSK